jgi:hypothetical protein
LIAKARNRPPHPHHHRALIDAIIGTEHARRFSPPWTIDDNGACFIIRDHNGQALAYCYYEVEAGRRTAAGLLTRDEARRIASTRYSFCCPCR